VKSKHYNSDSTEIQNHLQENDLSYGDLVIAIGSLFINAPYQAATLEAPGKEKLIVNLSSFDCTTFVETVLALARCAFHGKITPAEFRRSLKLIRYRQGTIAGYSSQLHYFTDWLRDNEKKKTLKNVSRQFDAEAQRKKINYMTTHRESYAALSNEDEFQKMLLVEKNISRKAFHIIGKDKVSRQKAQIKNGDIIAFATNQAGLDVAHVGFAYWQDKNLHLLHASSKEGGVVISVKTLAAYLKNNKKYFGVILARPHGFSK
jgi:Protein of unknown function (DUF1460)